MPEIKCMPYTRDVLNFDPDPKDKDPNFNPNQWSKIGHDFLPFLNFERLGILRILDSKINIRYRVARCPNCGDLFDVFLNFTDGDEFCFERIWPHLFARKENSSVEIREYVGNPIILEFVKKVNGIIGNEYVRILFLSMVLFLIGVFPLILASAINHFSLLPGFLLPNFMPEKTLFYLVASIEIAIFLFLEMRFLNYLENTQDFYSLFKVKNKYEGITFWRNFVLSRFVGVQDVGKPAGLSQVDVFSSGAAILIMYAVWLIDKDNSSGFLIPATISCIFLYILATQSFWQRQVRRTKSIYLFCIFLVLLILGEGSILLFGDLAFWGGIFAGIDLFFWLVVAYFFGRVAWLGLKYNSLCD